MQENTFFQKAKKIVPISLGLVAVFWFGSPALGLSPAVQERLCGITLVVMIYALLLAIPKSEFKEKTFFQNLKIKIPVIVVLGIIIWVLAGSFGFPVWWQLEFVIFALVGLIFFILLDLRPMKPEKGQGQSIIRLLATYALASIIFITVTFPENLVTVEAFICLKNFPSCGNHLRSSQTG